MVEMPIEPMTTEWNGYSMSFHPHQPVPDGGPVTAALVIAVMDRRFLLSEIPNRGLCIPSGHVEPGETAEEAARRETYEETGAVLEELLPIGHYQMRKDDRVLFAPVYAAKVVRQDALPKSEATGTRLLRFDELPALYHIWNPVIEQAFVLALDALDGPTS